MAGAICPGHRRSSGRAVVSAGPVSGGRPPLSPGWFAGRHARLLSQRLPGRPARANVINGKGGTGFIQKRGDHHDTVIKASRYTIAPR
jgi:hypothetical protein